MSGPTLVLLHGAGIGAWAWERVISNLSTPAVALDVPGRVVGATPQGCAEALAKELEVHVTESWKEAVQYGTLTDGPRLNRDLMFQDVFKEMPEQLRKQREQLRIEQGV